MKRKWTWQEKLLWAAPLLFGCVAAALTVGRDAVRRGLNWPQQLTTSPNHRMQSMSLAGNGAVIAAGGVTSANGRLSRTSGTIYLWNARTLAPLASVPSVHRRDKKGLGEGWKVYALALSPDARTLGHSRLTPYWELCDVASRAVLWRFPHFVLNAEFSRDGRFIALASGSKTFIVRASDGRVQTQWETSDHINYRDMAWSPDGTRLAIIGTYDEDDPIELRRVADGALVRRIPRQFACSVVYSPDGKRLLSVRENHRERAPVRCYDSETGKVLWEVAASLLGGTDPEHTWLSDAIFSPDGRVCAVYQYRLGQVLLLDSSTGNIKTRLGRGRTRAMDGADASFPSALAYSPNGKRLFACASDKILVWDLSRSE